MDLWSCGVCVYEMMMGGPPFSVSDADPAVTRQRVEKWEMWLRFPSNINATAQSLIKSMICSPRDQCTAVQIKAHPFFGGLNFEKLCEMQAPITPDTDKVCHDLGDELPASMKRKRLLEEACELEKKAKRLRTIAQDIDDSATLAYC